MDEPVDGAAVDDEGGLASERGSVGSQHQRPDRLLILSVVWSAHRSQPTLDLAA